MLKRGLKKKKCALSFFFKPCNNNFEVACEIRSRRVSNTMSCGLIGGRTLRLAAPSGHVWRLSKGPRGRESRRQTTRDREKRTKKIPRAFSFHFRDNNTTPLSLSLHQPFKYKHKISLFSPLPPPLLFRFSLFCGLRRFALQLIISPLSYLSPSLPALPYLPHRRLIISPFLCFSLSFSFLFVFLFTHSLSFRLPFRSLFHHYYTRPYTAIMPRPRYTTQFAVMLAIKLN